MTDTVTSMASTWLGIRFLPSVTMMFFRLFLMLSSRWSLQVILTMLWAATRILFSSKSRAKSFLTICSQVVMAILMARSMTGLIHSCTDFSMASLISWLNSGWSFSSGSLVSTLMCGTRPDRLRVSISRKWNLGSTGRVTLRGAGWPGPACCPAACAVCAVMVAAAWGVAIITL